MKHANHHQSAFTLVELLVVIAIITILAVVVVFTLNPAQLLAQSRDVSRMSDMATLSAGLSLFQQDQQGASLGNATSVYISIPDTSSICSNVGLSSLSSSTYSYACSPIANYRAVSSAGWLPINFNSIVGGSPFGSLAIDPVNRTSSNLYYTYTTGNNQYALTTFLESQKYAGSMGTTGGVDPALYEVGSGIANLPDLGRGLVGYWPLNEGSGNSATDWSGGGNSGTWYGASVGTSGHYSPGNVDPWAGAFDGTSTYVKISDNANFDAVTSALTVAVWADMTALNAAQVATVVSKDQGGSYAVPPYAIIASAVNTSTMQGYIVNASNNPYSCNAPASVTLNAWHQLVLTEGGGVGTLYIDGSKSCSFVFAGNIATTTGSLNIGQQKIGFARFWNGLIGDVRLYNRALSAAEIQQLYNAEN